MFVLCSRWQWEVCLQQCPKMMTTTWQSTSLPPPNYFTLRYQLPPPFHVSWIKQANRGWERLGSPCSLHLNLFCRRWQSASFFVCSRRMQVSPGRLRLVVILIIYLALSRELLHLIIIVKYIVNISTTRLLYVVVSTRSIYLLCV